MRNNKIVDICASRAEFCNLHVRTEYINLGVVARYIYF